MKKKKPATPPKREANVVAITGGIGSGKSSVARLFEKWGAAVVDADALARVAVEPGSPGLAALIQRFGEDILDEDGRLDREKLGTIIFTDKASRAFVESTLHPIIRQMWLQRLQLLKRNQMIDLIVYVVPLFFESKNSYPEIKKVILITAPEEVRLARVVERDVLSREAALARIRAQLPESEKVKKSDYVIPNDESIGVLEARARLLYAEIARKV